MGLKGAAVAGAALLSFVQYAHAQNFNQMIAFGDSTTDTARDSPQPPSMASSKIRWPLAAMPTLPALGPATRRSSEASSVFRRTRQTRRAEPTATLGPGFQNLFSTTYGVANPNLPGTATQIGNYLASLSGRANPNALYLISSG